jgi:hypothetical protein
MNRQPPTKHRFPDWFKRQVKWRLRHIGESKARERTYPLHRVNP